MTNLGREQGGPVIAQVTFSENGDFGAASDGERRSIPVFAPRGIAYRPCEGDNLLIIPVDGMDICVGVLSRGNGVAPGETSITSSGGAKIHLKNNGEISLNGLIVTKDGRIAGT